METSEGGENLQRTPLYETHLREGGRMVAFGGWEMPVQYSGINEEHLAVRRQVGLFDVSHMGQIFVRGRDGLDFLQHLLPADVARLSEGRMLYTVLCNERGGAIDDLVVYHLGGEFLLVVNAARIRADWAWIEAVRQRFGGQVETDNASAQKGMLAVQGPEAEQVLAGLAEQRVGALTFFACRTLEVAGCRVLLSRSGYTGEDGFEIVCERGDVEGLWEHLRRAGARPCGLGARDTLRTEAGLSLYGHELDEQTTPLEAGLSWALDLDKEADFIGREALRAKKEQDYRRIVGFILQERGIPRAGQPVLDEQGNEVGRVSSGTYSPQLQQGIGLAFVERRCRKVGTEVQIDMRGRNRRARIHRPPFVPSRTKKNR